MNPSGPGLFVVVVGNFLITISILLLVIDLFRVLYIPGLIEEGCTFPGIYPSPLGFLLCKSNCSFCY